MLAFVKQMRKNNRLISDFYISICRKILTDKKCNPQVIYRFALSGREGWNAFENVLCSAKYVYINFSGYFADLGNEAYFHSDKFYIQRIMECIGSNIEHLRLDEVPKEYEPLINSICESKKLKRLSLEDGYFPTDHFKRVIECCSNSMKILFSGMPIAWNVNPLDLNLETMIVECFANERLRRDDYLKQNFYKTKHLILRFYECDDVDILQFFGMTNGISTFVEKLDIEFTGVKDSFNQLDNLLQRISATYPNLSDLKISFDEVRNVYGISTLHSLQPHIQQWNEHLLKATNTSMVNIQWQMKCAKKVDFKYFAHRIKDIIPGFKLTVEEGNLMKLQSSYLPDNRSFKIYIENFNRSPRDSKPYWT